MSIWNAVLIIGIRFNANITSNLAYLQSARAFPTLTIGLAFTITNAFARFTTLFAPIITEYMLNPSITVTVGSGIAFLAQFIYT